MFNVEKLQEKLFDLVGWKQHFNTDEIELGPELTSTASGLYYQSFSSALRLDIVEAAVPEGWDLDSYLSERIKDGIAGLCNDIVTQRGYDKYARQLLANDIILDKQGWINNVLLNNGRFCGFVIKTKLSIGLRNVIKAIGMQQTGAQTLKIYVFHTTKTDPVAELEITTQGAANFSWTETNFPLEAENDEIIGGAWVVGYYQDDLAGQAIQQKDYNWMTGPCGTCSMTSEQKMESYRNLSKYMSIFPIYVPADSLPAPVDGVPKMFDLDTAFYTYDTNFGLNFKISAECDLTQFMIDHKLVLANALGLKVALLILEDIKFTTEVNRVEEQTKALIIRDLEGDKETNGETLSSKYTKAIDVIGFNHSAKSAFCLPCENTKGVQYGVA